MTRIKYLLILVFVFICSVTAFKLTHSYFSDTEKILGNSIQVGVWGTTPSPIVEPTPTETPEAPTPTPTPTPTPMTNHLVINEVYYNVKTPDKGTETTNEWIEIYNPTNEAVNISGWKLEDNQELSYQRTIPPSPPIPGHGYAVITPDTSTWNYWLIPTDTVKIVLDNNIGNGLADAGDRLVLKDELGSVVDQMSYGSDTTFFVLTPVHEGHSWERSPAGKDTDTAGDFIEQTNPTPGS